MMKILGFHVNLWSLLGCERRKAERIRLHHRLYLDYYSPLHKESGCAKGKDISLQGIRFACDKNLAPRTPLVLTLRFSPEYGQPEPIQARVYVVHCSRNLRQRRYRVACEFDGIDPRSHKKIRAFVNWLKDQ